MTLRCLLTTAFVLLCMLSQAHAVDENADDIAAFKSDREKAALRQRIEQCWNPPSSAATMKNSAIKLYLTLNPDLTVADAEILDRMRYNADSTFRSVADSLARAAKDPKCSPMPVPAGQYDQWKQTLLTFDPKDML